MLALTERNQPETFVPVKKLRVSPNAGNHLTTILHLSESTTGTGESTLVARFRVVKETRTRTVRGRHSL